MRDGLRRRGARVALAAGNGVWGIFCDDSPSNPLIIGQNPTGVSGNTAGDIHCRHA